MKKELFFNKHFLILITSLFSSVLISLLFINLTVFNSYPSWWADVFLMFFIVSVLFNYGLKFLLTNKLISMINVLLLLVCSLFVTGLLGLVILKSAAVVFISLALNLGLITFIIFLITLLIKKFL